MAKGSQTQIVTKKHLARVERERRQNRIILIASIADHLSCGRIAFLRFNPTVLSSSQRQPVAVVGDDAITTHEFQAYARYLRFQYIQQYATICIVCADVWYIS